jgi:hypothetical protein
MFYPLRVRVSGDPRARDVGARLAKVSVPFVGRVVDQVSETELDLARRIAAGVARSPTQTPEFCWFSLRWSGTGTAWRSSLNEHVLRAPGTTLSLEMIERLAGLPVVWLHPKTGGLDSESFERTVIGTIAFGYVAGPSGVQDSTAGELWCAARIYDATAIKQMSTGELSTSPAVSLLPADSETIPLQNGQHLLVEGNPVSLSHLAIVPNGVWDKGGAPSGIRIDNAKD